MVFQARSVKFVLLKSLIVQELITTQEELSTLYFADSIISLPLAKLKDQVEF